MKWQLRIIRKDMYGNDDEWVLENRASLEQCQQQQQEYLESSIPSDVKIEVVLSLFEWQSINAVDRHLITELGEN